METKLPSHWFVSFLRNYLHWTCGPGFGQVMMAEMQKRCVQVMMTEMQKRCVLEKQLYPSNKKLDKICSRMHCNNNWMLRDPWNKGKCRLPRMLPISHVERQGPPPCVWWVVRLFPEPILRSSTKTTYCLSFLDLLTFFNENALFLLTCKMYCETNMYLYLGPLIQMPKICTDILLWRHLVMLCASFALIFFSGKRGVIQKLCIGKLLRNFVHRFTCIRLEIYWSYKLLNMNFLNLGNFIKLVLRINI